MRKKRDLETAAIKSAIVESSDGCFAVKYESDGSGYHYTIYSEKETTDLSKLKTVLESLNLSKRFIIILTNSSFIEFKRVEKK